MGNADDELRTRKVQMNIRVDDLTSPEVTASCVSTCKACRNTLHRKACMRSVATAHLRKGVAANLLRHILDEAKHRSYRRLSLETGSGEPFAPAIELYTRFGFRTCGPFADYREDPFSVFMTIEL
jgi:putative acetyltransferase